MKQEERRKLEVEMLMMREEVMEFVPTIPPPSRRQGHPLRMHVGEKSRKIRIQTQ